MLSTLKFKTDTSDYIREIMALWLGRYLWIFLSILVICGFLAAFIDTAFLVVALIVLFLVFPFVVTHVYFNYALKPTATKWGRTRSMSIDDKMITVIYYEDLVDDDHALPAPAPDAYPLSSVIGLKIGKKSDAIYFSTKIDDFIIISPEAFSEEDYKSKEEFHAIIFNAIQENSLSLRS